MVCCTRSAFSNPSTLRSLLENCAVAPPPMSSNAMSFALVATSVSLLRAGTGNRADLQSPIPTQPLRRPECAPEPDQHSMHGRSNGEQLQIIPEVVWSVVFRPTHNPPHGWTELVEVGLLSESHWMSSENFFYAIPMKSITYQQ